MIDILKYINILKVIGNKSDEWGVLASLDGSIVNTYKCNSDIVFPNNTSDLVSIVNHVDCFIGNVLVPQPFELRELLIGMHYKWNLNIAIDGNYIYTLKIGTDYENNYVCDVYDTINKRIKEEWRFNVIRYNLSLHDYITNVNHAVITQVCKKLGWYYSRQPHGFYKKPISSIVIPPRELPSFIFQSEEGWTYAKNHITRWKKLMSLYPELRKFNFDVTDTDYTPMISKRKLNLDAV